MCTERLRAYLRGEREKLRGMDRRAIAAYLWQYYWLWMVGAAAVLGLAVYITVHRLTVPTDNWFSLTLANTYAEAGEGSELWEAFVAYAGYDTREKNVYFNDSCYFDPDSEAYNAYYTYFVAYVEAGTLDAIVMERDDLTTLGTRGFLLDLSRSEAARIAEKYGDRFLYVTPARLQPDGRERVPVGIDLSGTRLTERDHIYADACALGLSANCPHMEAVEKFLDFLFEEDGL